MSLDFAADDGSNEVPASRRFGVARYGGAGLCVPTYILLYGLGTWRPINDVPEQVFGVGVTLSLLNSWRPRLAARVRRGATGLAFHAISAYNTCIGGVNESP